MISMDSFILMNATTSDGGDHAFCKRYRLVSVYCIDDSMKDGG
jgi:hypothetical protein